MNAAVLYILYSRSLVYFTTRWIGTITGSSILSKSFSNNMESIWGILMRLYDVDSFQIFLASLYLPPLWNIVFRFSCPVKMKWSIFYLVCSQFSFLCHLFPHNNWNITRMFVFMGLTCCISDYCCKICRNFSMSSDIV